MDLQGSGWTGELIVRLYKYIDMCVNLEWVTGSRQTGTGLDGLARVWMDWWGSEWTSEPIVRVYKKIDMCVNLEWVAGSRLTGEGLEDRLVRVRMEWWVYSKGILKERYVCQSNLEWLAGCRRTGKGLDRLARVWMDWRGSGWTGEGLNWVISL